MNVKSSHPAPDPCPHPHRLPFPWLQLEQGMSLPWAGLMPQHHPGVAFLAECPHRPPCWSLSSPFLLKGNKNFRKSTVICWRSLGSWKSPPTKDWEGAHAPFLEQVSSVASRKGWLSPLVGGQGAQPLLCSLGAQQHVGLMGARPSVLGPPAD